MGGGILVKAFGVCVLAVSIAATANAEPLPQPQVQAAMARVEQLLARFGIDIAGYARSETPQAELSPADHPYLQGNAGGYADGRVYISNEAIEACRELTLIHELVHDASVKHRLFAAVPNDEIRGMFEALADLVTEAAAEDPYLPGCLPKRHFEASDSDVIVLAKVP